MSDRRAYLTAKKRESRERARLAGRCIICTKLPATDGLATCAGCRGVVTTTRRDYKTWGNGIVDSARELAGDDAIVDYHQPADRMAEFLVRSRSAIIPRTRRVGTYDWRDTDPQTVVRDVIGAYNALREGEPALT